MYTTAVRFRLQRESPDIERRLREALDDHGSALIVVSTSRLVDIELRVSAESIEAAVAKTIQITSDAITATTKAGYAILHVEAYA